MYQIGMERISGKCACTFYPLLSSLRRVAPFASHDIDELVVQGAGVLCSEAEGQ